MGLEASAELPRRMADVAGGQAGVLRHHMTALDPQDEASKPEHAAYERLASETEQIAGRLRALADEMSGYSGLPMANHDMEALLHPRMRQTFEALVNAKRDLRQLLEAGDEEDQEMLGQMQG